MTPERYHKIYNMLQTRQPTLTVVMEDVHKPHNLAAIARTCDAVGIPEIHAITPYDKLQLTVDAASGSGNWVDVKVYDNIETVYSSLKERGFQILATHFEERAKEFRAIDYTQPTAIVMGQELEGISTKAVDLADGSIIIPMYGMVQSLNVSVAASTILYEAQRQRSNAGMYATPNFEKAYIDRYIFEKGYPRLAALLQSEGKPYPALDAEGQIIK